MGRPGRVKPRPYEWVGMAEILIAGLESWLTSYLAQKLPGSQIVTLADPDMAIDSAAQQTAGLLIVDHGFAAPDTPQFLARLNQFIPVERIEFQLARPPVPAGS